MGCKQLFSHRVANQMLSTAVAYAIQLWCNNRRGHESKSILCWQPINQINWREFALLLLQASFKSIKSTVESITSVPSRNVYGPHALCEIVSGVGYPIFSLTNNCLQTLKPIWIHMYMLVYTYVCLWHSKCCMPCIASRQIGRRTSKWAQRAPRFVTYKFSII